MYFRNVETVDRGKKRIITQLLDADDVVFMSNTWYETQNMVSAARWFKGGDALIGGLGLGLIVKMIAHKAARIDIVELNQEVIDVVFPTLDVPGTHVYPLDIEAYVCNSIDMNEMLGGAFVSYDYIFIDTWSDLDFLRLPAVHQFKKKCQALLSPGGRVLMWGEHFMRQSFKDELYRYMLDLNNQGLSVFPEALLPYIKDRTPYFYPFCRWLHEHPGIWADDNSVPKVYHAVGQFTKQFINGPLYLALNEPTKEPGMSG